MSEKRTELLRDDVVLFLTDCMDGLKSMPDNCVDSMVTDPPYGLSDHSEKDVRDCMEAWMAGKPYAPKKGKRGFMGKSWDSWVPGPEVWKECYRVLKPGAYVLCFASSRTEDLMSMALRLAGFRKNTMIAWCFGCLSEDTELLIDGKWQPYRKAMEKGNALCYNVERDEYKWEPIQDFVEPDPRRQRRGEGVFSGGERNVRWGHEKI